MKMPRPLRIATNNLGKASKSVTNRVGSVLAAPKVAYNELKSRRSASKAKAYKHYNQHLRDVPESLGHQNPAVREKVVIKGMMDKDRKKAEKMLLRGMQGKRK